MYNFYCNTLYIIIYLYLLVLCICMCVHVCMYTYTHTHIHTCPYSSSSLICEFFKEKTKFHPII